MTLNGNSIGGGSGGSAYDARKVILMSEQHDSKYIG